MFVEVAKIAKKVLPSDVAVVILVHEEERLPHRVKIASEFPLHQFFYHVKSLECLLKRRIDAAVGRCVEFLALVVLLLDGRYEVGSELWLFLLIICMAQMRKECPLITFLVNCQLFFAGASIQARAKDAGVDEEELDLLVSNLVAFGRVVELMHYLLQGD